MEYKVMEKVETIQGSPAGEETAPAADTALSPQKAGKLKGKKKPGGLKGFFKRVPVKRIILIAVIVGAVGYIAWKVLVPAPEAITYRRVAPLAVQALRNTVDVTGNVESEDKSRVYSTLTHPITEVAVNVGDKVEEGQLLCRLDTDAIEADIKAKQASIGTTSSDNSLSIAQAEDDLETARLYYENGKDADILAAESALEAAERSLRSAEFDVRTAEQNYSQARRDNRDAEDDGNDPVHDKAALNSLRDSISKADIALESAQAAVEEAKQKLQRTKEDAARELQRLEEAVLRAKNSANQTADYISLDSLRENLEKCTVTSPSAGTVTAVYAKEGDSGEGILFVIEDPEALVVETTVMEYDVNTVAPGQKVEIKSDATGDKVFLGEVLSVSPASVKDAEGKTVTGSTASFEMKIKVTDKDTGLRIGMNVRASVILEEKPQTAAVLYEAVGTNPETGEPVVFVAEPAPVDETNEEPQAQQPTHIARMIPVTTGMETDLYWEVSSPDLKEGDLILQDPGTLTDGMPIHIADPSDPYGTMGGMGGGMAETVMVG